MVRSLQKDYYVLRFHGTSVDFIDTSGQLPGPPVHREPEGGPRRRQQHPGQGHPQGHTGPEEGAPLGRTSTAGEVTFL